MNTLVLDLKFQSSQPTITDRVINVAEAFGIGIDETRDITIFNKDELRYEDTDLIYVTGDSGSGKSCFLKLFSQCQEGRGRKTGSFESITMDPDEVIVNGVGKNFDDASNILSTVGLSEAFIMIHRYKELSDGQKYRYKLAKLLNSETDIFLIDEFGASLDRVMAKVLAFNLQKWARRMKKQAVIATTHHDLIEDFNPNILIFKPIGKRPVIQYFKPESKPFSLIREMRIQPATAQDYESLSQFHYLHSKPLINKVFKLVWENTIIAVIVYSLPFLAAAGRHTLFPEYDDKTRLNAEVRRISRVIIDPKFRGVGLGHMFVSQCNNLMPFRVIETLAVMAKYNPFFQKAGMRPGAMSTANPDQARIVKFAEARGFKLWQLRTKTGRQQFLNSLTQPEMQTLIEFLIKTYKTKRVMSKSADKDIKAMMAGNIDAGLSNCLPTDKVYLYWVNPNWKPA